VELTMMIAVEIERSRFHRAVGLTRLGADPAREVRS
jgi:hypothetical protein